VRPDAGGRRTGFVYVSDDSGELPCRDAYVAGDDDVAATVAVSGQADLDLVGPTVEGDGSDGLTKPEVRYGTRAVDGDADR
jgi:hypothetical protein